MGGRAKIADPIALGLFPLQQVLWEREQIDLDDRNVLRAVRVKERDLVVHKLGHEQPIDESGGDILGGFLWLPQDEGVPPPEGPPSLTRYTSAWRMGAWPSIVKLDTKNRLNDTEGNAHGGGVAGDPSAVATGGGKASKPTKVLPIFGGSYRPDTRFAHEIPFLPDEKCFPRPAGNSFGLVVSADREDRQDPLWMQTDPRLIAPHFAGDWKMGSIVADLNDKDEIDPERCARLQTIFRVVKRPDSNCADFHDENSIAWNITEGGRVHTHGGLVCDKPFGGGQGKPPDVPTPSSEFPPVSSLNPFTGEGGGGGPSPDIADPATAAGLIPPFSGPGQTVTAPPPSVRVHGLASQHQSGPFVTGHFEDVHRHALDADGNPINSLHLSTNSLFYRSRTEDAPLHFEGRFTYPLSTPPNNFRTGVYTLPVHLELSDHPHSWCGGSALGLWKWRAQAVHYLIHDTEGPPGLPRPPTDDPNRPPVPTPGIGDSGGVPFEPNDPTPVRPRAPSDRDFPVVGTTLESAAPAFLARPQFFGEKLEGQLWFDYRNAAKMDQQDIWLIDHFTPVTARLEAFGAQREDAWSYNEKPGSSKYVGGTASGGFMLFPPEISLADADGGLAAPEDITISTSYLSVLAEHAQFAAGTPDTSIGGIINGYRWTADDAGRLLFQHLDASGLADAQTRFTTTGGHGFFDTLSGFWGTIEPGRITADRQYDTPDASGTLLVSAAPFGLFTPTQVAFADAGGLLAGSADFTWDDSAKTLLVNGKLTVTGSIDPTDIILSGGGTSHFQQFGDGLTAPVSASGSGRIRYNDTTKTFQVSLDGAAYVDVFTGTVTPSGWTDDGANVRLTTAGDTVSIGTASASGKVRVLNTTDIVNLRLDMVAGQTQGAIVIFDSVGNPVFSVSPSGSLADVNCFGTLIVGNAGATETIRFSATTTGRIVFNSGGNPSVRFGNIGTGTLRDVSPDNDNEATSGDPSFRWEDVIGVNVSCFTVGGTQPAARMTSSGEWLLGPGGGTAPDVRGRRSAAATLTLDDGAAGAVTVVPASDGVGSVGTASVRWSLIRGVTVTGGDFELVDEKYGSHLVLREAKLKGEDRSRLYVIDKRTGKKYRLLMEPVK